MVAPCDGAAPGVPNRPSLLRLFVCSWQLPWEALSNTGTLSQQTRSARVFPSSHGLPEARCACLPVLASPHTLRPPVGVQRKKSGPCLPELLTASSAAYRAARLPVGG